MRSLKVAVIVIGLVIVSPTFAGDDARSHASCKYCGMDRVTFGHASMLLEYTDGSSVGTCSIHCSVIELASNAGLVPCAVKVGDYTSKKLIDAYKASWVIGGSRPGVMTNRAKWAFEREGDARAFVKAHGGELSTFYGALKAAFDDLYEEVRVTLQRTETRQGKGLRFCK